MVTLSYPQEKPVADKILGFHLAAILLYSFEMGNESKLTISGFKV